MAHVQTSRGIREHRQAVILFAGSGFVSIESAGGLPILPGSGLDGSGVVAVLPPSAVVTVIFAGPAATGVTTPVVELTLATLGLSLLKVTLLLVALAGSTVAVSVPVASPAVRLSEPGFSETPVTEMVAGGGRLFPPPSPDDELPPPPQAVRPLARHSSKVAERSENRMKIPLFQMV
jgi:hypothetical protein